MPTGDAEKVPRLMGRERAEIRIFNEDLCSYETWKVQNDFLLM